jgi:hypothetical protein
MAGVNCGCAKQQAYAALWTPAGLKAQIHLDGSVGSDGPDGETHITWPSNTKQAYAKLIAAGWVKRG